MNFVDQLAQMVRYSRASGKLPPRMTVAVTPKYARRVLLLPADAELIYNGIPLRCIGSKAWRARQAQSGGGRSERSKSNLRRMRETHNVAEAHL